MLAGNDRQILSVNTQLDQVWRTLSADREELSTALNTLGTALADIQAFIRDNRAAIKSNVDKLARTTQQLVDNRATIAEALDTIPLAVTNFYAAYDPASESLQGRTVMLDYFPVPLVGGGR
jgi:phospholipid/cholesterol/gamma-HCH transport system substrate-binding protein